MKPFVIILLFFLSISFSYAMCSSEGFQFYPQQRDIPTNSLFMLEGYADSQKQILEFKKKKLYLLSECDELIALKFESIQKGQMDLMQAIFKPSKELDPHTIYYLKNPFDASGFFTKWYAGTGKMEKVQWRTNDVETGESTAHDLQIEFENTKVHYYGCGPAANAIFNIKTTLNCEIWYKTEVVNLTNNQSTTYILTASDGQLQVGHGMCAGAFTFNDPGQYIVKFTPITLTGAQLHTTQWFRFNNPYDTLE